MTDSQYLFLFAALWIFARILTGVWVHVGLCESGCISRAVAVRRWCWWCWRWAMESSADPGVHTDTSCPPQRPFSIRAGGRVCRDRENSHTHTLLLTGSCTQTHAHTCSRTHTHLEVCTCPWRFDRWATAAWMATAQPSFSHCAAPAQPEQLLSEHLKERESFYTCIKSAKASYVYVCV